MFFSKAAYNSLITRNAARRVVSKRFKADSSSAGAAAESSSSGGGLIAAMGVTFGTYMTADFLSNFLQHPTQSVSVYIMFHYSINAQRSKKLC